MHHHRLCCHWSHEAKCYSWIIHNSQKTSMTTIFTIYISITSPSLSLSSGSLVSDEFPHFAQFSDVSSAFGRWGTSFSTQPLQTKCLREEENFFYSKPWKCSKTTKHHKYYGQELSRDPSPESTWTNSHFFESFFSDVYSPNFVLVGFAGISEATAVSLLWINVRILPAHGLRAKET